MIKKWDLQNFKSVSDKITLEMAPLTIFVGANNSGKSTLIQSMLIVAQTLQSPVYSRSVVLNGHIVRLGSFNDIISNKHPSEKILIGFTITPISEDSERIEPLIGFRKPVMRRYLPGIRSLPETSTIECNFTFSTQGAKEQKDSFQLQPVIEECNITFDSDMGKGDKEFTFSVKKSQEDIEKRLQQFKLIKNELQRLEMNSLEYEITNPPDFKPSNPLRRRFYELKRYVTTTSAGVSFVHFLPKAVSEVFDEIEEQALLIIEALTNEYSSFYRFEKKLVPEIFELDNRFKKTVLIELKKMLNEADTKRKRTQEAKKAFENLEKEFSVVNAQNLIKSLYEPQKNQWRTILVEKLPELYKILGGETPSVYGIRFTPLPNIITFAIDNIQHFFTQNLQYLGPLRDEPKPIYPFVGATDSRNVGIRGEYTAAVLNVHGNTTIEYVPSEQFALDTSNPTPKTATLSEAVLDWLTYMGVANKVNTVDLGKIGHELKVTIDSNSWHDLIHVGVGVSQVLPIIVFSLIAEQGATLIFEQPELHLHPRVQTRLADFFLSMTILKKQCIVETHSEYLINRLRYRAATSEGDKISNDVITLSKKNQEQSTYRPIRINKFGVITDWPKGFFDENEENATKILKAGMEKRRREAKK